MAYRLAMIGFAVLTTCQLLGCSKSGVDYPAVTLTGTVTVNGEPLEQGSLSIRPVGPGQGNGVGGDIVNGQYRIANAPLGESVFLFNAMIAGPDTGKVEPDTGRPIRNLINLIPKEHRDGVVKEVTEAGKLDFEL